jgi:hypothetical protein
MHGYKFRFASTLPTIHDNETIDHLIIFPLFECCTVRVHSWGEEKKGGGCMDPCAGDMPLVTKRARGGDAPGGSGDGDAADDDNEHHVCARGGCEKAGIKRCGECKQVT